MTSREPWSKKHKRVTRASAGGMPYSLSNSFAQPLSHQELVRLCVDKGHTELVRAYNDHHLCYTPNGGSADLRNEIAGLYGPQISADNILVFAGAQVALQTAAVGLASDCHSIVFTPGYQSTVMAPALAGGDVTQIQLLAENGWQVDIKKVKAAIREDTKYIVVNEPYNPAGTLMSQEVQQQLIALAAETGIYILSDEVYRLLEHDPDHRLGAMADLYHHGISAVTMSKPWGGCGITIGWLAFQDLTIKQRLVDVQYFGTATVSRASEIQAMMVLRNSDEILNKNLRIIRHNLSLLKAFMNKYSDLFDWIPPKAGAVCFIRFKGPLSSEQLGEHLAHAGIGIKPAYCFTDVVTPHNDYFRVGFGESVMPEALDALIRFVEANKQAWRSESRL